MKESTHKKLDKKLSKLHEKVLDLTAQIESIQLLINESCENHSEEKPVAKKRGKKKK